MATLQQLQNIDRLQKAAAAEQDTAKKAPIQQELTAALRAANIDAANTAGSLKSARQAEIDRLQKALAAETDQANKAPIQQELTQVQALQFR